MDLAREHKRLATKIGPHLKDIEHFIVRGGWGSRQPAHLAVAVDYSGMCFVGRAHANTKLDQYVRRIGYVMSVGRALRKMADYLGPHGHVADFYVPTEMEGVALLDACRRNLGLPEWRPRNAG